MDGKKINASKLDHTERKPVPLVTPETAWAGYKTVFPRWTSERIGQERKDLFYFQYFVLILFNNLFNTRSMDIVLVISFWSCLNIFH